MKDWMDMLNLNISSPVTFVDKHIGKLIYDTAVQTDFIELKISQHKPTLMKRVHKLI